MSLNRLKANICGTTYTLVSEESLSYMRDLVAQVDAEMAQIVTNDRRMSTTMAAVLTALQNADKANKESKAAEDLRLKLKRMVDDCEHLKDQLAAAREENARLSQEILQLRAPKIDAPAKKPHAPKPIADFEELLDESEDF
ncbi:MAG: cell division protein ZapA [Clostridia bacterium]|nr:cell division protein ZapA [Clostridia bacterium]